MGQGMTKVLYYVLCFTTNTNSKKKKKNQRKSKHVQIQIKVFNTPFIISIEKNN
jgi:hypothetical protein